MKNRWIRELLSFSRKERSGIIVLLMIIFLIILSGTMIPLFIPKAEPNFSAWKGEIDAYLTKSENKISSVKELNPVPFDPNKVDSATLATIGLPVKLANNWLSYLSHGGRFRDKEGIKKIYGMTSGLFEQLDRFIVFPAENRVFSNSGGANYQPKAGKGDKRDTLFRSGYEKKAKPVVLIQELNRADSINLLKIPGIGSILASRIIRYRNLLGGFYDVSQIREVYGFRGENFQAVSPFLSVDATLVKALNVNFSTVQDLGRHPYIGYRTARKLIRQRDKNGMFLSAADLSESVGSDSLKRLIPYLQFSQ